MSRKISLHLDRGELKLIAASKEVVRCYAGHPPAESVEICVTGDRPAGSNSSGDMTLEDAAQAILELHDVILFEEGRDGRGSFVDGFSELTQQDVCQAIDFLSLAHHSMVKAQLNHAREVAERGAS